MTHVTDFSQTLCTHSIRGGMKPQQFLGAQLVWFLCLREICDMRHFFVLISHGMTLMVVFNYELSEVVTLVQKDRMSVGGRRSVNTTSECRCQRLEFTDLPFDKRFDKRSLNMIEIHHAKGVQCAGYVQIVL